jgi:stage II sporulation protein D
LGWNAVPSNAYALRLDGDTVALAGEGEGHGVGLCQFGAAELARQGWEAAQILRLYFVNAQIR